VTATSAGVVQADSAASPAAIIPTRNAARFVMF
jgi:hypothetical protein